MTTITPPVTPERRTTPVTTNAPRRPQRISYRYEIPRIPLREELSSTDTGGTDCMRRINDVCSTDTM